MDNFYALTNMGIAIIDLHGNILVSTGWQEICTRFHRISKNSLKNCIESDLYLTQNIKPGEYSLYKCKNNMWDIATPIIVDGEHMGNLFFGQFFFEDEEIDYEVFKAQAEKFGFDKEKYLKALELVPRRSKEQINILINFYSRFAGMISTLGYNNVMLAKSLSIYKSIEKALKKSIAEQKEAEENIKKSYQRVQKTLEGTINCLSSILELKDPYTGGHQKNVAKLCTAIAQELKMDEERINALRTSALIHDIGKIVIPPSILSKPTALSEIEISMIQTHSTVGYEILNKIDFGYPLADIILQHHERINGSGYPNKLKDKKILLEAKVLGVADTVEAMANHRPYRPAFGIDKALNEIEINKNILYDSSVVEACLKIFREKGFKF